jgi:LuxR family maltose regulon positive regulatory protein
VYNRIVWVTIKTIFKEMESPEKPIVRNNLLKFGNTTLPVGSVEWHDWVSANKKFRFESAEGAFSARRESRGNNTYWYAYRRKGGKLFKTYLGKSNDLIDEVLEEANHTLTEAQFANSSRQRDASPQLARIDFSVLPKTKVTAPMLPQKLLERPRLIQQINTPLTLIYAPSGFGKSTLLNSWSRSSAFPVAWLSLDKQDNQPVYFLYSLVTALKTINAKWGEQIIKNLRLYASSIKIPELVTLLTNEITGTEEIGLILDDFQHIHHSLIFDFLQALFAHMPPNLHLIISGNIKPPLLLGELRAKSMVTELAASDLRFNHEEGTQYLRMFVEDTQIPLSDLEKLVKHTEGWAVGLTLTALALSQQDNPRNFARTFSGTHIYFREYFMETVHRQLSAEMQAFLLKTSILKQLNGDLCDVLTGQTNGEATLAKLWQENQLITKLEEPGWYRYHDLFAEMLNDQLKVRYPEEMVGLHQKAAQWLNEHGAPSDAISHLLAAESWEEAASLIASTALREIADFGEDSRLLRWLLALPETVFRKHKNLLFIYLHLASVAFPRERIKEFIDRVEIGIRQIPSSKRTQDEIDVLKEVVRLQEQWQDNITDRPLFDENEEYYQDWNLLSGIHWLRIPEPFDMAYVEEKIYSLYQSARRQKNLFVLFMAGGTYLERIVYNGQLGVAEEMCYQILQFALDMRDTLPETASLIMGTLCYVHLERHQLTLAKEYLARLLEVDPNPTSTNMPITMALYRAKIQAAEGQFDDALVTLQSAKELNKRRPSGVYDVQEICAYEAIMSVRSGNLENAQRLLSETRNLKPSSLTFLAIAILKMMQGDAEQAEEILKSLLRRYPYGLRTEPLERVRIPLAIALFDQHKIYQAKQVFMDSIHHSAHERMYQPYIDFGEQILPLLMLILRTVSLPEDEYTFIENLLKFISSAEEVEVDLPNQETIADLAIAASITEREQEVLSLLCRGFSNRKIAEELFVCESTVKTHLSNIYKKLKVNNRVLAKARADELELV